MYVFMNVCMYVCMHYLKLSVYFSFAKTSHFTCALSNGNNRVQ